MRRLYVIVVVLACGAGCDDAPPSTVIDQDGGPRTADSEPVEMRDSSPRVPVLAVSVGPRALVAGETVVFDEGEQGGEAPFVDLTVTNQGRAPLSLEAVNVEGDIRASAPPLPVSIDPGQNVTFRISVNNAVPGPKRGAAELVTDLPGAPFRLEFSGVVHAFIRDNAAPHAALEAAFSAALEDTQVVGATLAVVQNREVLFLGGFGHENRRGRVEVDPRETRFRWADLSKTLTGVLATQAATRGTIDLDTTVRGVNHGYQPPTRYLPDGCLAEACALEIPEDRRNVTFRRLLTHTTGIQHFHNGVADPRPPADATSDPEINDGIAWTIDYWKTNPLVAIPGDAFNFSSLGYVLAGMLLEVALSAPFDTLVQREIAEKVGMTTLAPDSPWADIPRRSRGYTLDDGLREVTDDDVSWQAPAGGYISTGLDLARFCGALSTDAVVNADDRRRQLFAAHPPSHHYGFGFGFGDSPNGQRIVAYGAGQKARSGLRLYPNDALCFVLLTNSHHADAAYLLDVAEAAWRETPGRVECPHLRPAPDGRRGHAFWGLSRAELPLALAQLAASGHGVENIDAFTGGGGTRYNIVSSAGTASQRLLRLELTEAHFDRVHGALNREGWRLHQFTTHRARGGIIYDAVWLPGALEQELHLGLTEAELSAEIDLLRTRRRRVYSVTATEGAPARFGMFSAAGLPDGQAVTLAAAGDIVGLVESPPDYLDAYLADDAGQLVAVTSGEDRGDWEMETASGCVDLDVGDGAALDGGQTLRTLTAYETPEGVRYNAVWTTR